ncbi:MULTISPECIES: SCO family protein [Sedimenticola]|uniref:SCO family protein n=1 Tax=Sedimenticola TaxID=349742 RepID=UPI0004AFAB06|nr:MULTISPECIES: SCO family protein [Sedimenticola]MCW8905165.1 SCO family protein [Sedimenticola sp.]
MRMTRLALLIVLSLLSSLFTTIQASTSSIGGDFTLINHEGKTFHLQQLRGKVVLLFFGYTYCPDICPTELAGVSRVLDGLGTDADRVQGVFVSLDPERDTPRVLKDYLGYFNQQLIGLTGSDDAIRQVAIRYQVRYQKHSLSNGSYSLDHSANLYIIDQDGQLFSVVPYGLPPEHVQRVVRSLLDNNMQSVRSPKDTLKDASR